MVLDTHRREREDEPGVVEPRRRLVVIGQGYVGLPVAMRGVEAGYEVVGLDVDDGRVERLMSGMSFVEDVEDDVLRDALARATYRASTDYRAAAGFDVAVISVPTPLRDGAPDLSYIEQASRRLARYLRPGALVVLESTTYPGTTEELVRPLLEEGSGLIAGVDFHLGYSPERVDPGNAVWHLQNTPKVVAGVDDASLDALMKFYGSLVEHTVPVSSCRVAELTKLLENTFRHVNIALVNELAVFAHELGVDVWEAIEASSTKPFGFMPFQPGPGVGGHCLPVDPAYLSWRVKRSTGHSFRFVELACEVNDSMPDYVVRRITLSLNERSLPVRGTRILVLGIAYKPDTSDARESPALRICELLRQMGAQVSAADPHVAGREPPGVPRVDLTTEEVDSADLIVMLVNHRGFDLTLLDGALHKVLDTRNVDALRGAERL